MQAITGLGITYIQGVVSVSISISNIRSVAAFITGCPARRAFFDQVRKESKNREVATRRIMEGLEAEGITHTLDGVRITKSTVTAVLQDKQLTPKEKELGEALEGLLNRYIDTVDSYNQWNPEDDKEVVAARRALR